jgi:hypothetical protein
MLQGRSANPTGSEPPSLLVVIDTEEEFDWDAPFDRAATSVETMRHVGRAQQIFDHFDIRPVYVVDYPVASQPAGYEPLREFASSGRAVIGAHLHPWVTPPHEEEVSAFNSFAGNLPLALERDKLARLADQIERVFGERPTTYKAGRYGFGPNTAPILLDQGFEVDLSFCPPFDFSDQGGPDFSAASCTPFWFETDRPLLEVPSTGAYVGLLRRNGRRLRAFAESPALRWARLPGIFSRSGLLDRLHLSPEGYSLEELILLTRTLHRQGLRTFTLSFHSPSLDPGHTSYVRSRADLEAFLMTLRCYFDYFFGELGGVARTPLELKAYLEGTAPPVAEA